MAFAAVEHNAMQRAYDHLNARLFDGQLPALVVLLHRKRGAAGYFRPEAFAMRGADGGFVHEIALNPDTFKGRTDVEILSTLAHEQAHQWQQDFGKPPRRCYHDKQWAEKMEEIGLMPSHNGEEGGRRTGQRMTHYVISGGEFEAAAKELIDSGFKFGLDGCPGLSLPKKKDKVKYVCDYCQKKAWAKPGTKLVCGDCGQPMESEDEL